MEANGAGPLNIPFVAGQSLPDIAVRAVLLKTLKNIGFRHTDMFVPPSVIRYLDNHHLPFRPSAL
eukprot:5559590-Pyramimonas_sp.AAC.1